MSSFNQFNRWLQNCVACTFLLLAANGVWADPGKGASGAGASLRAGNVLPATARPQGFSLDELAAAFAAYNEYVTLNGAVPPQPVPDVPFQMLHVGFGNQFNVRTGTFFYVPMTWGDNSPPIFGDFPADVTNRSALLKYLFSAEQNGLTNLVVKVDGKVFKLDTSYASGVFVALPTGGTQYVTVAAVISPLPPGRHVVGISLDAKGALGTYSFSAEYIVNVN